VAAVETAAGIVGQFGALAARQARLGMEFIVPVEPLRPLEIIGADIFGGPQWRAGYARMHDAKHAVAQLARGHGQLLILDFRRTAVEIMDRATGGLGGGGSQQRTGKCKPGGNTGKGQSEHDDDTVKETAGILAERQFPEHKIHVTRYHRKTAPRPRSVQRSVLTCAPHPVATT
jgi:hypothetical protein